MAFDKGSTYWKGWLPMLISLGVALLSVILSITPLFRTVDYTMRDQMFKIRGPMDLSESPVVLVTISQKADDEIPYKYPWPTDLYARLIENLNEAGAEAIAIDVIFDQPDTYDMAHDTAFAKALAEYENVVLAGKVYRQSTRRGNEGFSQEVTRVDPIPLLKRYNPNPFGVITNTLDSDDVLRRYLLFEKYLNHEYFALGLEALRIYKGVDSVKSKIGENILQWGSYDIPIVRSNSMYINYYGSAGSFPSYSFDQVIDDSTFQTNFEREAFPINSFNAPEIGLLQRGVFEDKIVLVGSTMPELHDFHATPFSGEDDASMPGVEVHANALQTVIDQNYISVLPYGWELMFILLISLVMVLMTRNLNIWASTGVLSLTLTGYFIISGWLFLEYSFMMTFTGPLTAAVVGYGGTLAYHYLVEQREKKRIKEMFQSYVSPALVERMVDAEEAPKLGGEKKYMTAFFSDIEAFSTISEQVEADRLVRLINEYLSAMTEIINEQGGTLDKYIGDAIVAFYGAPLYIEDHAYRACVTSQLMQIELNRLCQQWKDDEEEWPNLVYNLKNRVGINTGYMVTGNMGSERRFNYTIMGDHVNLAARCESGAKSYGVYTMVTEYTKQEAEKYGDRCVFRFLDKIVVKGRTEPVNVYEIYGLEDWITSRNRECIKLFEEGYQYYLEKNWGKAIDRFERSEQLEDHRINKEGNAVNPSRVMLERCRNLEVDPPDDDWNGVYVMEHK